MSKKILFILKRREDYSHTLHTHGLSTGLLNSATYVQEMLVKAGIDAVLEVAIDNNCIDRLVTLHKPDVVILEALWVVPSKFDILIKLHPTVEWIIRLHSEMPFMANEGIAMEWMYGYTQYPNVNIGVNAPRMLEEVRKYLMIANKWENGEENARVIYMPNYYPIATKTKKLKKNKYWIDVGCFGAVRPLKNHLVQAIAAIKFAHRINKQLRFHINAGRIEMKGEPVLHNLQGLFESLNDYGHQLVLHDWMDREAFIALCAQMDLGMQVSFSETFNIVGADFISQGVPIVGSSEIPWSSSLFNADPTSSDDIENALLKAYAVPNLDVDLNANNLKNYVAKTQAIWVKLFR